MNINKKFLIIAAAVLLLAAGCAKTQPAVQTPPAIPPTEMPPAKTMPAPEPTPEPVPAPAEPKAQQPFQDAVIGKNGEIYQDVSYKGQAGKTALELLKANYPTAKTKSTSFGEMVVSINNITPDAKHFWAFYINGKFANVGAGSYVTKATDQLSWKLEEIK